MYAFEVLDRKHSSNLFGIREQSFKNKQDEFSQTEEWVHSYIRSFYPFQLVDSVVYLKLFGEGAPNRHRLQQETR